MTVDRACSSVIKSKLTSVTVPNIDWINHIFKVTVALRHARVSTFGRREHMHYPYMLHRKKAKDINAAHTCREVNFLAIHWLSTSGVNMHEKVPSLSV